MEDGGPWLRAGAALPCRGSVRLHSTVEGDLDPWVPGRASGSHAGQCLQSTARYDARDMPVRRGQETALASRTSQRWA